MELPKNPENRFSRAQISVKNAICEFFSYPETIPCEIMPQKYSYIFRRKSRWELTRISAVVTGIEFCYSAETAYVTPVLLSLGLNVKYVSMIWCLSPLIAFVLTPILGSLSDSCHSSFGRRRPFISMLSVGIIIGLIFIPYGGRLGLLLGDKPDLHTKGNVSNHAYMEESTDTTNLTPSENSKHPFLVIKTVAVLSNRILNDSLLKHAFDEQENTSLPHSSLTDIFNFEHFNTTNKTQNYDNETDFETNVRIYGIVLSVIGTVFLDFCADVCQSPCRAYLLDITLPEEHATGLTIFCLNSGLGSAIGYIIAAVKWDIRLWGNILEGQVILTFSIIAILYVIFLGSSLYSFPETPLSLLKDPCIYKEYQTKMKNQTHSDSEIPILCEKHSEYLPIKDSDINSSSDSKNLQNMNGISEAQNDSVEKKEYKSLCVEDKSSQISLKEYLKSIIFMPKCLRILCLTNFLYGMGIISYTLFFTDFVGECVFEGNPGAPKDSKSYELYKEGVRFGCWGMAFGSLSCALYSSVVEHLAERFGAKIVFVGGALVYSTGMVLMAVSRHKVAVIILSSTAGIMFTTLSTLPYILVAHYHSAQKFRECITPENHYIRGLGTDVATVISVVVLSQCILSFSMGAVVESVGSSKTVPYTAALFSALGAISATQVVYHDL